MNLILKENNHPESFESLPFQAEDLQKNLANFLNMSFVNILTGQGVKIGNLSWCVYTFLDYDGEPIYVGQTRKKISTQIHHHLTTQRTDAVAMSVLDPFEILEIEVWPLPQFQKTDSIVYLRIIRTSF